MKKIKLVYGVGINDSDYPVQPRGADGKPVVCPFYERWRSMLSRCYNKNQHVLYPRYIGSFVVPEWHYFMTFRSWMEKQDWKDKELDKDLLFPGNKIYGPNTCLFVSRKVNGFLTESNAARGDLPIGVTYHKLQKKYMAQASSVVTGKTVYLGLWESPEKAHQAWLCFKIEQAKILITNESNDLIKEALLNRYLNYNETEKLLNYNGG